MTLFWKKLAAAGMALLMAGCGKTANPESFGGGTVDNSDPDAPKVIESTEITEFSVNFFLAERWAGEGDHRFEFEIKPDENGVLTAYENRSGNRCPADDNLLQALQEVISQNGLAAKNGVHKTTSGLPAIYQPRRLSVVYASGETLYYTANNNPHAVWAVQICDVFSEWFNANGIEWNVERLER